MDPYATLGVPKTATRDDIRRAYRRKAKNAHPDSGGDSATFQALTLAHRILADDEKRARFDQTGEANDQPDLRRTEALQRIGMIVFGIAGRDDALAVDIAAEVRKGIKVQRADLAGQMKHAERDIAKLAKMAKRFSVRKGANYARDIVETKVREIEGLVRQMANADEVLAIAEGIAADMLFEKDKPAPPTSPLAQMMYSSAIGASGLWGR